MPRGATTPARYACASPVPWTPIKPSGDKHLAGPVLTGKRFDKKKYVLDIVKKNSSNMKTHYSAWRESVRDNINNIIYLCIGHTQTQWGQIHQR